jgi:hypothetical protein
VRAAEAQLHLAATLARLDPLKLLRASREVAETTALLWIRGDQQ